MAELLKSDFLWYLSAAMFMGLWLLLFILGILKITKNIEKRKTKTALRISIVVVAICVWIGFFVLPDLYPISVAYYEYNNNLTEETIGIVSKVDRAEKDRILLSIEDKEYVMVYHSNNSSYDFERDIVKGDMVQIQYGKRSKFVFNICKLVTTS